MSFTRRLGGGAPSLLVEHTRSLGSPLGAWDGVIVGLPLDPAMSRQEYRQILAGGSRRHAARPDAFTRLGRPLFHLSDLERRERDRLLAAIALPGGFETAVHHNVGCDGGRNNLLELAADAASTAYTGVQYCAVGTGVSVSPVSSDETLVSEFFRKAVSIGSVSTGQALLNTVFETTEGNGTYTEAGLFGSDPSTHATGTTDSGIMFAHSLFAYVKTNVIQLAINYYISLT